MEINYTLTADDYRDALNIFRSRRFFGRWFWRLIWVPIALALVMPLVCLIVGDHDAYLQMRPLAIVGVLWAGIFAGSPRLTARRYAKGIPGAGQPRTMTITDDGINPRNAASESKHSWSALV